MLIIYLFIATTFDLNTAGLEKRFHAVSYKPGLVVSIGAPSGCKTVHWAANHSDTAKLCTEWRNSGITRTLQYISLAGTRQNYMYIG